MNYRLRVSVKVEQGSNLTFTRDLPYIASIQNWRSVQKWNKTSVLRSTNLAFYKCQWSLESFTDQTFFIAGFQPRDKATMLVYKTIKVFFAKFACRKSLFPAERLSFVFVHQRTWPPWRQLKTSNTFLKRFQSQKLFVDREFFILITFYDNVLRK